MLYCCKTLVPGASNTTCPMPIATQLLHQLILLMANGHVYQ